MSETLVIEIQELRKQRKAVILAHNYTSGEVQDVADYVGDSLGLSQTAANTTAEVIVFCGVHFMAETAAILSPDKTVIVPDEHAGCPMANMVTPRQLQDLRDKHPNAYVVTYVNSSAATKAISDICCTSANAVEVLLRAPENRQIIFVPDRNLGAYAAEQSGRQVILFDGFCPTHQRIIPEHVAASRQQHPEAVLVAHPECPPQVVAMADFVGSTTGILRFCQKSEAKSFLIGTEVGILHRLRKDNPGKTFTPASPVADCPNMKLNSLEKILWCLQDLAPVVTVEPDVAEAARLPIQRMLEVMSSDNT